jgi:hypothetical protein
MMPAQQDTGYERVGEVRDTLKGLALDLFHAALVGAMAMYLDRETLGVCVESALEAVKEWDRPVEKIA